jgi:MGT family glycosyltransferase
MRLLAYTSPGCGHLYPIVPTLLELERRGHQVALRTLAAEVDRMRSLRIEARPIDTAIEAIPLDDWRHRSPVASLDSGIRTFLHRGSHEIQDLARAIDEESPDMLLVDLNTWGAGVRAERSGLPWSYFAPYFLPVRSDDAPPFGLGLRPRRDLLGRVRDRLARRVIHGLLNRHLPDLNRLRASLALPPIAHLADLALRAPLVLSYTAEPFEYPRRDWPASVVQVGPGIWDPPESSPAAIDPDGRALLLVTCSSEFQNDGRMAAAAITGLAEEDFEVVVTTGGNDPASLPRAANARVERFVPHSALLTRAACVVCHGGMGITQKALAAGIPVVVVPFGRDQIEVARHVEVAGCGVVLRPSRLAPERVREAVRCALGKKDGAAAVAAGFSRAGGAAAAADAIESLAHRARKGGTSWQAQVK